MGNDARILVPQMARVWLAPVGTAAPADPIITPAAAWKDVGFFTPDSLQWATDPNFETVTSHQSNYPTRRFQTTDSATVQVNLQEWSVDNFKAVYGGGTFTEVAAVVGPPASIVHYKFAPPAIGGRTQTAAMIEIIDGTKHYRTIIPKCEQTEGVELGYDKTNEVTLPLRLSIIGSDVGDPWYMLTDDPAMDPVP
jgi:hypothetical protein